MTYQQIKKLHVGVINGIGVTNACQELDDLLTRTKLHASIGAA